MLRRHIFLSELSTNRPKRRGKILVFVNRWGHQKGTFKKGNLVVLAGCVKRHLLAHKVHHDQIQHNITESVIAGLKYIIVLNVSHHHFIPLPIKVVALSCRHAQIVMSWASADNNLFCFCCNLFTPVFVLPLLLKEN